MAWKMLTFPIERSRVHILPVRRRAKFIPHRLGVFHMKIAIPVWEEKVSPVFDTASRLRVYQLTDREEKGKRFEALMDDGDFTRRCYRIKGLGVEVLICGAISRHLYGILSSNGVQVIPWISGRVEEVLEAYLDGTLFCRKFLMPGCNWKNLKGTCGYRRKRLKEEPADEHS